MSDYVFKSLEMFGGLICLKESVLEKVLSCKMFTANYPILLEHIIREANHYIRLLKA